jgi:beta-N-acetylhexosaminidase
LTEAKTTPGPQASPTAAQGLLGRVVLAFEGETVPGWVERRLRDAPVAGMTLFRHHNVGSPGQVRELTEAFQRAGGEWAGGHPLLVAADSEGGQLQALGDDVTPFAGNMALGAIGDQGLAERVGGAIGLEARAMGVNVAYAPVLDLATEPGNVALGVRSFGDDPDAVAGLGAAMIRGLQGAGVAATVKHFPGLGEVKQDTHHALGVVDADGDALSSGPLAPFRAGIGVGARLVMSAHVAVPALTGDPTLPATLSEVVLDRLLRSELGFDGVTISDALDMRALAQGAAQPAVIIAAVNAGVDLLLCSADRGALRRIEETLVDAASRGLFEARELQAASDRVLELRAWLGSFGSATELSVVGCSDHRALSREVAERSLTLVRGEPQIAAGVRILAVMPQPTDLTPADTSSTVAPGLAPALRGRFGPVEEVVVAIEPTLTEIAGVRARADASDVVVVGTIDAIRHPGQLQLIEALCSAGRPVVAAALRTPWDVGLYPESVTAAVCTYSILPDSLEALARGLVGEIGFDGRLPVAIRS